MKKFLKNKTDMLKMGDKAESGSFKLLTRVFIHLLSAFFLFKKRKGDIVGGGATFFAVMSFCPVILLMISLAGMIIGDVNQAKTYVLDSMNSSFPHMAEWIYKSIEKIVSGQLKSSGGLTLANTGLLLYSSLGVVASVVFGIDTISKEEPKGGFIFEDGKSLFLGVVFYVFILTLVILTQQKVLMGLLKGQDSWLVSTVLFCSKNNISLALISLGFFTMFYKFAPPIKVPLKDAFMGALAFIITMGVGKSLYWFYINFAKEELTQNFGNFYTLIVAVLWVYFMMCAFFYGACVAYLNHHQRMEGKQVPSANTPKKMPPPPPSNVPKAS